MVMHDMRLPRPPRVRLAGLGILLVGIFVVALGLGLLHVTHDPMSLAIGLVPLGLTGVAFALARAAVRRADPSPNDER